MVRERVRSGIWERRKKACAHNNLISSGCWLLTLFFQRLDMLLIHLPEIDIFFTCGIEIERCTGSNHYGPGGCACLLRRGGVFVDGNHLAVILCARAVVLQVRF